MRTAILLFFALLSIVGASARAAVVLHDTFNDDTLGQAPGTPEVGSSFYWGTGTHTVINDFGSQSLRSVDSSASDGYAIQWIPTGTPAVFDASFLYRMESFAGASGLTIGYQNISLSTATTSETLRLHWKSNNSLELLASTPTIPSFTWATGTTYQVRLRIDCTADTTSLWVDNAPLVSNKALGFDCNALVDFTDGTAFTLVSTRSLDELKIFVDEPFFADGFESGSTSGWSATMPPPPVAGDSCTSAISYAEGTVLVGDLSDNTASGMIDSCSTGANTIDEWLTYTASCDGTVTVTTCHPGTTFDTIVSVWDDASCQGVIEVACNDDADSAPPECDLDGANRKSLATFNTLFGSTYVFRVSAWENVLGTGAYEISAQCAP